MRLASGALLCNEFEISISQKQAVCEMVRKLNEDQRRIFDAVMEMFESSDYGNHCPFYPYITGQAGIGKTFLMKTLNEAAKIVFMRSGDDLNKQSVVVLSPTASAAKLVNGESIESGMMVNMETE